MNEVVAEDTMSVEDQDMLTRVQNLEKMFSSLSWGFQGMAAHTMELAGRVGQLEAAMDAIFAQVAEEEALDEAEVVDAVQV